MMEGREDKDLNEINEKKELLLKEDLCDRCLGRQFGELGYGLENFERGSILRNTEEVTEDSFSQENVPALDSQTRECFLCENLFDRLNEFVERIVEKLSPYELKTILVGTRVPEEMRSRQDHLWDKYGKNFARPIKSELNRTIGKKVIKKLDVKPEFGRPDVNVILDLKRDSIELQLNSEFYYGKYNKYQRGIPQTVWHCRECRGTGCKSCNYTGKKYPESVQEIIQKPFIEAAQTDDATFHGAGREDIDVRCFAKREFVLELNRPKKRNLDPARLVREVNARQKKVEIFDVSLAEKGKVESVKKRDADKTYRAVVKTSEPLPELNLENLKEVPGQITQRTPQRVSHRRADKARKRKVYWVECEAMCEKTFELIVKAEAGTYIKELISGNGGRTHPNVADALNCKAECEKLDVLDIS